MCLSSGLVDALVSNVNNEIGKMIFLDGMYFKFIYTVKNVEFYNVFL